jgi:hypothetical protein
MNAEVMPTISAVSRPTPSQRFFEICYLTAISVATIGWVSAVGWVTVKLATWLLV